MISDATLLEQYSHNQDAEAFAELARRYAGLVYGTCLRITGNPQDAEDIAQECFLELAKKAGTISSSLPGWLHRVAHDRAVNSIRNACTRREYEVKAAREVENTADPTWADIAGYVDKAIEDLPANLRNPIILHYLQGYSQSEVADKLHVSQPTVSRLLDKGIETLRAGLKRDGIIISVTALAALFVDNQATAAPASLTAALGKMAVSGVGCTAAKVSAGLLATLPGKIAALGVITITLLGAGYGIQATRSQQVMQQTSGTVASVPTPQFVVDELKKQAEGKTVEVIYSYGQIGEAPFLHFRYIRTPEVLYLERQKNKNASFEYYCKENSDYRFLYIHSGGKDGVVSDKLEIHGLGMQMPFDPIIRPLDDSTMLDVIGRGTISPVKEPIDGYPCWRIDSPANETYVEGYTLWVDPAIGCCPRQIEINYKPVRSSHTKYIKFNDYKEVAKDIWFPSEITITGVPSFLSSVGFYSKAESITVGKKYTPASLMFSFPSGTVVNDKLRNTTYTIP